MVQVALLIKALMAQEEGHLFPLATFHAVDVLVYRRTAERPFGKSQIDQIIGRQIGGGELDGYPRIREERAGKPSPIAVRGLGFDRANGHLRIRFRLGYDGLSKRVNR